MIATLDEIKSILQITDNTKDTLINQMIPIAEQSICDYCRDYFLMCDYWFNVTKFENGYIYTSGHLDYFKAFDSLRVFNSVHNNYSFTVDVVEVDRIKVNSIDTIVDEIINARLVKVQYPRSIKFNFAKMIEFDMTKQSTFYKTEKIDDYQYTINDTYPPFILQSLKNHRKIMMRCYDD